MKKKFTALIRLALAFALLVTLLPLTGTECVSASSANKKAQAIFEKKIQKIAESSTDHTVYYRYLDLTGDSEQDAILQYHTADSGSADTYLILTRNGKKVNTLLSTTKYGVYKFTFYKKAKSMVCYSAGHGGETYTYYKLKKGTYKEIASKSRTALAGGGSENGKWYYYDAQSNTISKAKFNGKTKGLKKGSKKVVQLSNMKLYK